MNYNKHSLTKKEIYFKVYKKFKLQKIQKQKVILKKQQQKQKSLRFLLIILNNGFTNKTKNL